MPAAVGAGYVDPLDEGGQALAELVTPADVPLAIGFDVEGVEAVAREELVAPIIGHPGLQAVLVVVEHRVSAVADARDRELSLGVSQSVVVVLVALDDRVIQDRAKSGIPEVVLEREFPAIELGGL